MKRTLLLSLALVSVITMANIQTTQLVILSKDGMKVAYALVEKPKITFTENELVVKSNNIEVKYVLEKMSHFSYESGSISGIADSQTNKAFSFQKEALVFPDLAANSTVCVYSLNGSLVFKKTVVTAGDYVLSTSDLKAGVYLVSVNGLTYKIVKR